MTNTAPNASTNTSTTTTTSTTTAPAAITVCALYKFVRLENFEQLREPLLQQMQNHEVKGTLLLASEGINGTIAGPEAGIKAVQDWLKSDARLTDIVSKESYHEHNPFNRTKVKLKKEIVTMGIEGIDPRHVVGTYVKPDEWNDLISDPEVLLVDTRNDYEVEIGTFKHAVNPNTKTFREFPDYVKENLDPEKHKKVAMFCTGGIRCEKSTAYLKEQGFDEVYHLEGGILKYLEEMPEDNSLWQGECYVFDGRVSVNHDLEKGQYDMCNACRLPITEEDKQSEQYEAGVSCPKCYGTHSEEQIQRFRDREKQVQLAKARGIQHVGGQAQQFAEHNRELKQQQKEAQRAKNS